MFCFILLNFLLFSFISAQDCILSAIMSTYQCSNRCLVLYGSTQPTQRLFYNSTSQLCQPKTSCPTGWTYLSNSNACVNDLGQKNTVINGWILSSNVQNLTVVYVSCSGNGNFFNATCICNPGWKSSLIQTKVDANVTTMKFCDVEIKPADLRVSQGETIFGGYSWSQKREAVDEKFADGEKWFNGLVGIALAVYSIVFVLAISHWIVSQIKKTHKKNQNNERK